MEKIQTTNIKKMTQKEIKEELFRLLWKTPEELTLTEWRFIHTYITYEILNEFIDVSGLAVLIPGLTEEEEEYKPIYPFSLN